MKNKNYKWFDVFVGIAFGVVVVTLHILLAAAGMTFICIVFQALFNLSVASVLSLPPLDATEATALFGLIVFCSFTTASISWVLDKFLK